MAAKKTLTTKENIHMEKSKFDIYFADNGAIVNDKDFGSLEVVEYDEGGADSARPLIVKVGELIVGEMQETRRAMEDKRQHPTGFTICFELKPIF